MPYKFLTDVTLAREFGMTVEQLLNKIKSGKIKCIVLKEQIVISESEFNRWKLKGSDKLP